MFQLQSEGGNSRSKRQRTQSPSLAKTERKVNKLIIKNDTDDEEELRREVENSAALSKRKREPIKFDTEKENAAKMRSLSRERRSAEHIADRSSSERDKEEKRIRTSKDGASKYANLPSCE